MKPIRSFQAICRHYRLNQSQTDTLQSFVDQRKGVLHPYWVQLTLYVPYDFAKRLHDELVANEWAVPDEVEIDGMIYETELTNSEVEAIARIELQASNYFSLH